MNAVEVEGLGKRYQIGERHGRGHLRDAMRRAVRRLAHGGPPTEDLWSLRDVSFEVPQGEALGIIGRNGAGKSTLLKVLGRITDPTEGRARIRGRPATLLEVGTGFHPELTGRENVLLNGAILGMTRGQVEAKFDDIVAFAGVERFLDTPVKRYSSGMRLRLAFAVAAHVEPDVLLVDEILAVGDAQFQQASLGRMADVGSQGRTVLFVSHDLDAIAQLCRRTIWLDRGRVRADGPTAQVLGEYLGDVLVTEGQGAHRIVEGGAVALDAVRIAGVGSPPGQPVRRGTPVAIEVQLTIPERVAGLELAVYARNARGVRVFDEAWRDGGTIRPEGPGTFLATIEVPPILNVGEYVVGVWAGTDFDEFFDVDAVARFRIEGDPRGRPERALELGLPWSVREADPAGPPDGEVPA